MRELEKDTYFYHPDHIGSANWITNSAGEPIQHLQYLPFGELRLDQRLISWHSRYTFSAKEKDEESGYSYFGARYYDSDLSIFISCDKALSDYPSLTPYHYCANNPMVLVDPDGNKVTLSGAARQQYFKELKGFAQQHGISLKMNSEGVLSARYRRNTPISDYGQQMLNAVNSGPTTNVYINCIYDNNSEQTKYMFGGTFGGNEIVGGEPHENGFMVQMVNAYQTVIPSELQAFDEFYGTPGRSSWHELTEAFLGAMMVYEKGVAYSATGAENPYYNDAHNAAIPQAGLLGRFFYDKNGNPLNNPNDPRIKYIDWDVNKFNFLKVLIAKTLKTTIIE